MFHVLYRWQLKPGAEQAFQEGWSEIVHRNVSKYGAYGSQLSRCSDGWWRSLSYWPSEAHWLNALRIEDSEQEARQKMLSAVLRKEDPVTMTPVLDHVIASKVEHSDL